MKNVPCSLSITLPNSAMTPQRKELSLKYED